MIFRLVLLLFAFVCIMNVYSQSEQLKKISPDEETVKLSKSGKILLVGKLYDKESLRQIDSMLTSSPGKYGNNQIIKPACTIETTFALELEENYFPSEGKSIGIWVSPDPVKYQMVHNFGFRKIMATRFDDIQKMRDAGFSDDDFMYEVVNNQQELLDSTPFYYIDEPFELYREFWDKQKLLEFARKVYPKKLFIGSYRWPKASLLNWFNSNGSEYRELLNADTSLPIYIMNDEYHGSCHGSVTEYWDKFRELYGKENNISNWINLIVNSGDGKSEINCPLNFSKSDDYEILFTHADKLGLKELWLFAHGNYWNEDYLMKFINTAFEHNWIYRKGKEVKITWNCLYPSETNPCIQCDYKESKGYWVPVKYEYTGKTVFVSH